MNQERQDALMEETWRINNQWKASNEADRWGRDKSWSQSTHRSSRERSTSQHTSRSAQKHPEETPRCPINRQLAFGQGAPSSAPEVQDSQPVEMQGEETEIDRDLNLIHSPYNPTGDYLAPSPQATPAAEKEQLVHDPLPRYLIDLKPTVSKLGAMANDPLPHN